MYIFSYTLGYTRKVRSHLYIYLQKSKLLYAKEASENIRDNDVAI